MVLRFFGFALLLSRAATGTIIVGAVTPQHVAIGVDGDATLRVQGVDAHLPVCKALETDNALYVAAGLIPAGIKMDVLAIRSPLDAIATNRASEAIRRKLQEKLPSIQQDDPSRYSEFTKREQPLLTIYTVWASDGVVNFRSTHYSLLPDNKTIAVDQRTVEGNRLFCDCPKAANPPVPTNWTMANQVAMVKDAIAALLPRSNPITLVWITPQKIDWPERGNCKADGSNAWQEPP